MKKKISEYDLIVIGGGPGGSTLATFVAMKGHKVLLLEKEKFPRYQIGESLLPSTMGICKSIGVLDDVEKAGFNPKNGGVWRWGRDKEGNQPVWGFNFGEIAHKPLFGKAWAYQVERSKFDHLLLKNAKKKGVVVKERHSVERLIEENGRVTGVEFKDSTGKSQIAFARFVADAAGNGSPFHKEVGQRVYADRFRHVALFCYYRGGKRLPPPESGSILNVTFNKGWFWYIPLNKTLTSLGVVMPIEFAQDLKSGHEQAMNGFIESCPMIQEFLKGAKRITKGQYGKYRVRKDWSYCNSSFWKPGLVLIGDSACFVDPLFSSGVHLATFSALQAGRSINTCLSSKNKKIDERKCFEEYEFRYRNEYLKFFGFLTGFYKLYKTKEQYFQHAHKVIGSDDTDRQAFVRLVSGFSKHAKGVFKKRGPVMRLRLFGKPAREGKHLVPSRDGSVWIRPSGQRRARTQVRQYR